mmetsp:Transcript_116165/g.335485  ORF Transcript_116165/g.335485 Transcript_116165/m.335485 type:complete len:517 (-) Transcript_116165:1495-3045(-)
MAPRHEDPAFVQDPAHDLRDAVAPRPVVGLARALLHAEEGVDRGEQHGAAAAVDPCRGLDGEHLEGVAGGVVRHVRPHLATAALLPAQIRELASREERPQAADHHRLGAAVLNLEVLVEVIAEFVQPVRGLLQTIHDATVAVVPHRDVRHADGRDHIPRLVVHDDVDSAVPLLVGCAQEPPDDVHLRRLLRVRLGRLCLLTCRGTRAILPRIGGVPVRQHNLREVQVGRSADRPRHHAQRLLDAGRGFPVARAVAAGRDVAQGRHQVLPRHLGHSDEHAVVLKWRQLVFGSVDQRVVRAIRRTQRRQLQREVPDLLAGAEHRRREAGRPGGLRRRHEGLPPEEAALAVHAPVLEGGVVRHWRHVCGGPHRHAGRHDAERPILPLREARFLRVGDVLLQVIERGAPGAHRMGNVARLHHEVLDVLPVLPAEVEHTRDHPIEGSDEGVVVLTVAGLADRAADENALANVRGANEFVDELLVFHRHGQFEFGHRLPQLLGRGLNPQGGIYTRQQGAHRS